MGTVVKYYELPTNIFDLGWLVGMEEGEGCPSWHASDRCPELHMKNTDLDTMERYARLIGGNVVGPYQYKPRLKNDGTVGSVPKLIWEVHITGEPAAQRMRLLAPFMGQRRREKMREILGKWDTKTGKKIYRGGHCGV